MEEYIDKNRAAITRAANRDAGSFVKTYFETYLLLGAVDGEDDYYWLMLRPDGSYCLDTCLDAYAILYEAPPEMEGISKMQKTDKAALQRLADKIKGEMMEYGYPLLTEIKIERPATSRKERMSIVDWRRAYGDFINQQKVLGHWPFQTKEERRRTWRKWVDYSIYCKA